jgi:benzoyl-CoA 2,3-dioxygenase component B
VTPDGRLVDEATWKAGARDWLPTDEDRAYVASLMGRVTGRGRYANWIAPPVVGINRQPLDFEYIRFN